MEYLMTTSSLLCWMGACPAQYINVCWSCWSTHWGICVSFALRKWTPFLPQQDLSWPTIFSPFSASHISCFLVSESARGKGSFRRPVLHPAQIRINTKFRLCCSGIYPKKYWKSVNNLLQWLTAVPMVWLFAHFQLSFWLARGSCCVIPDVRWGQCCSARAKAPFVLHTVARKGYRSLCSHCHLQPALLQPSSWPVVCLAIFSKSVDSWRWCRLNAQAGRCQLTQTVFKVAAAAAAGLLRLSCFTVWILCHGRGGRSRALPSSYVLLIGAWVMSCELRLRELVDQKSSNQIPARVSPVPAIQLQV